LNVDVACLLIQLHGSWHGSVWARRVAVKRRQWATVFVQHGSARAHQITARSQLANAKNAAVVRLYSFQHSQRPRVFVHHHILLGQSNLVFIPHHTSDGAQATQPQLCRKIGVRLRKEDRRAAV